MNSIISKKKVSIFFVVKVLPIVIFFAIFKIICHYIGIEWIPASLSSYFPSILTGTIFILGFLLAGTVTDYKESEKLPNDIAMSLAIIQEEAEMLFRLKKNESAKNLMLKMQTFVPALLEDFFIKKNTKIYELIDSFSLDFSGMEKDLAANYIIRIKNEQANIRKIINRIQVIKDTEFAPAVQKSIQVITIVFLVFFAMLKLEPWWCGVLFISIFSFVIFTIILLIHDLEDPFEYSEYGFNSPGEIDMTVLINFHKKLENKN